MSKYTKTARSICDLLLFVALCVSIYLLPRLMPTNKRGFFCGDDSLSYPLRENTIGVPALLVLTLAVPGLVIIVVELFKQIQNIRGGGGAGAVCAEKSNGAANGAATKSASSSCSCGCRMGHRLLQCYKQLGYFLFGLALTLFTTQLSKYCIGRLRPHFFSVCQPVLPDGSNCADARNYARYIDAYTCSNTNATDFLMRQLNQSFPSGHTSLTIYGMVYVAIYLQAVLSTRLSKLLKHLLQFIFIMIGWYVALTRITDYWHHWSDVLAGALLGTAFAALVSIYVADLFAFKRHNRGAAGRPPYKPHVSPKNSAAAVAKSNQAAAAAAVAAAAAAPALPAYTFGTLPYLPHPAQAQYAQTYHNYGYVP